MPPANRPHGTQPAAVAPGQFAAERRIIHPQQSGRTSLPWNPGPAASDRSSERASGVPAAGPRMSRVCASCVCTKQESCPIERKPMFLCAYSKTAFWCAQRVHGGIRRHGCRLHTRELNAINSLSQNWTWCVQETRAFCVSLASGVRFAAGGTTHTGSAGVE